MEEQFVLKFDGGGFVGSNWRDVGGEYPETEIYDRYSKACAAARKAMAATNKVVLIYSGYGLQTEILEGRTWTGFRGAVQVQYVGQKTYND